MASLFKIEDSLHHASTLTSVILIIIFYLIRSSRVKRKSQSAQRVLVYTILTRLLALLYVIEGAAATLQRDAIYRSQARIVHAIALALVWFTLSILLGRIEVLGLSLAVGLFEVPILVLSALKAREDIRARNQVFQLGAQSLRILILAALLGLTTHALLNEKDRLEAEAEAESLLQNEDGNRRSYTHIRGDDDTESLGQRSTDIEDKTSEDGSDSDSDDEDARVKRLRSQRLKETGGWWGYLKDFSIFVPYLIPRRDRKVQFCYVICILCVAGKRALNILEPLQIGFVADKLMDKEIPYGPMAVWLLLSLAGGESGVGLILTTAKIPIQQFAYRQITNAAFAHVMSLGLDFHSERDSAEVMKAVEQGHALNNVLDAAVLEILPTCIDLIIAVFLLYSKFGAYMGLAMVTASIGYLVVQTTTANWNMGRRRKLTKAERDESKIMHQAVQGWQTVSYFNMFFFERHRFGKAVDNRCQASTSWNFRDAIAEALEELLIPTTFFCLSCIVFLEVSRGQASGGDFVFLIQYWEKLVWPLKILSQEYRWLMRDLVDAERLLELFRTQPTVTDKEGARDLVSVEGRVTFEHVYFSYDKRKQTVQDLDLTVEPGETIALVGMTGAGKSSILKLLLRFYDIKSGQIKIDGHDIRDVTLGSLRDTFGIVPQDPMLFNASIKENLRYARPSATDDEIEASCRAAAIHDKILTFPERYDTRVGENGIKLSGGEVQRLAIARVFLKDPPVLILDEATSAVDTATELEIQGVLAGLQRRRTTFVIAHRLSTVVSADRIVVMHDGRIAESGTHEDLLRREGGMYKDLWTKQIEGLSETGR